MLLSYPLRRVAVAFAAFLLVSVGQSLAQAQGMTSLLIKSATPSPKTTDTSGTDNAGSKDQLAQVAAQQTDIQRQLDLAVADNNKAKNAFGSLTPDASEAQRQVAMQLEASLQTRVDFLSQINDLLKELERQILNTMAAEAERDNWKPPAGTPPWALSTGDDVLIAIQQFKAQINKQDKKLDILDQEIIAQKKRRSQAEIDLRQSLGTNSNNKSNPEADALLRLDIDKTRTKLDLYDLDLIRTDVERRIILQLRRLLYVQLSTTQQTWDFYQNRFSFTQQDLDDRLAEIDKKISGLRTKELEESSRLTQSVAKAKNANAVFESLQNRANVSPTEIAQAKRNWLTLDSTVAGVRTARAKYRALIELELLTKDIWSMRQQLHVTDTLASNLKDIQLRQSEGSRKLDQGIQYLKEVIDENNQSLIALREQRNSADSPGEKSFYEGLVQQNNARLEDLRSIDTQTDRVKQLLSISAFEIENAARNLNTWENFKNFATATREAFQAIWRYELIAVDDTAIVDGREIKTKRSVTIGKSIGALAILFIGFSLISTIIKRTLALAVSKAGLTPSRSVVVGRWLTLGGGITLVICAFNLVEIPLSAFAFFGGALAIGVGFGTQNLLKNLFSGVMLLVEKSIRIGDVVEVDNITGTVTSIGIRFSTIQSAHGTDNLIPNSVLVEQKLVNWTYSTPDVRREIQVTVAYGSDVNRVIDVLVQACSQQEGVLSEPAPMATLHDFADRGLVFIVQLWITINPNTSVIATLGTVRLAILDAFKKEGIELPFPQYVVQLKQDS